jgi:hypothetical protein
MRWFPIVHRELVVASRRAGTWWLRGGAAVIGAIVLGAFLMMNAFTGGQQTGRSLFLGLSWIALIYCAFVALLAASDAVSEEKREGTLGLLFLTNLTGLDVVLSKLAIASLGGLFAFLAMLPVLGITIPLGGVSGEMFGAVVLVLLNALFAGVAVCLAVSAASDAHEHSLLSGIGMLTLLMTGLWPAFLWLFLVLLPARAVRNRSRRRIGGLFFSAVLNFTIWLFAVMLIGGANWSLPGVAFAMAQVAGGGPFGDARFWLSVLAVHGFTWGLLWAAARRTAVAWKESGHVPPSESVDAPAPKTRMGAKTARDRRLLESSPVQWLVRPAAWARAVIWIAALVLGLRAMVFPWTVVLSGVAGIRLLNVAMPIAGIVMMILLASVSAGLFTNGRRDGGLELLLVTPVERAAVLRGVQRCAVRTFLGPYVLMCLLSIVGMAASFVMESSQSAAGAAAVFPSPVVAAAIYPVTLLAQFFSVVWLSQCLAWTLKRPGTAPVLTLICALFVPSIVVGVVSVLWVSLWGGMFGSGMWMYAVVSYGTPILVHVLIFLTAKRKLASTFVAGDRPRAIGESYRRAGSRVAVSSSRSAS